MTVARWTVLFTEAQLRAVEFAVFALIAGATTHQFAALGYSLPAAQRALVVIQRAQRVRSVQW